uniref:Uncharacterized protein n=1 Tax=Timema douglasi TaxID=61478 RepID=A0A7R8VL00_TIMDO|nr:unnamed protein product [Timema douglasi]
MNLDLNPAIFSRVHHAITRDPKEFLASPMPVETVEQAAEIAQTRESLRLVGNLVEAMVVYLADVVRRRPSREQLPPTTMDPEGVRVSVQIPDIQSLGDQSLGSLLDMQDRQALWSLRELFPPTTVTPEGVWPYGLQVEQLPPTTVTPEGVRVSVLIPDIQSPGGQSLGSLQDTQDRKAYQDARSKNCGLQEKSRISAVGPDVRGSLQGQMSSRVTSGSTLARSHFDATCARDHSRGVTILVYI